MTRARNGLVALLAAGAGWSAGCGGGASGPSHADYAARAERICGRTTSQARPLLRRLAAGAASLTPATARELAPVVARVRDLGAGYVARLAALQQPGADKQKIERMLSASRDAVAAIGQAVPALSAGQTVAALSALQSVQSAAGEANAAAGELGLSACAKVLTLG